MINVLSAETFLFSFTCSPVPSSVLGNASADVSVRSFCRIPCKIVLKKKTCVYLTLLQGVQGKPKKTWANHRKASPLLPFRVRLSWSWVFLSVLYWGDRRNPTSWCKKACLGRAGTWFAKFFNWSHLDQIQVGLCLYRNALIYTTKVCLCVCNEIVF